MRRALMALAVALLLSACDSARGTGQSQLIDDLADRLGQGDTRTYTATYQLPGGATAVIARSQRPARLAVVYPGGKIVYANGEVTTCKAGRCTSVRVPSGGPGLDLLAPAAAAGLAMPSQVADMLAAAALDPRTRFERRDTTIVGLHATCVRLSGAESVPDLDACVTSDGILGSFAAMLDGRTVDVTLTGFRDTAEPGAFNVPRP